MIGTVELESLSSSSAALQRTHDPCVRCCYLDDGDVASRVDCPHMRSLLFLNGFSDGPNE